MSVSGGSCCQQCSSTISKGQRFCANCGLRVDYDTAQGNLCTGNKDGKPCYNLISPAIRFCSSCGTENETYISDKTVTQTGAHITKIVQIDESDDDEYFSTEEDSAGSSTKNDIQRNTYLQSENDGLHDYLENIESSTENEAEFQKLYAKYKKYGFMKTTSYCRNKLNEVNTGIIKFAVIGRSAVGKSSFINMMLDLQAGKKCYAETGSGDTTQEMIVYKHPKNENITFWDMPGFGTIDMTKEKFMSEFGQQLHTFDYFFIFIDTVIMEEDLWLVNHIQGFGTPYCLVRSKFDEYLKRGRTKENIRQKLKRSMEANDTVKGSALFIISNEQSYCHTGDLRELFSHITKYLPLAKAEILAFFLPFLTPELIEKKFQLLQRRIKYIAFLAGVISAIPIPFLDIPVNIYMIGTEIEGYYRVFLLDKDIVLNVPGIKNKKMSKHTITQSTITFFKAVINVTTIGTAVMSQADIMVPGVGSVVAGGTTFTYACKLLSNKLKEMKNDAYSVYEYYAVAK